MKLLVVGDFHGKFPRSLKGLIKKEKIDLILSTGDYCGNEELGKLFFKYYYDNEDEVPKDVEKKVKRLEGKSISDGLKVVRELKKLKTKSFGVRGNWDPLPYLFDIGAEPKDLKKSNYKELEKLQTKDFTFIDFKLVDMDNFVMIGGASSTHPGKNDKKTLNQIDDKKEVKRRIKEYNRRRKLYERMFLKARTLKKPVIFLTHNCPYGTRLDKVKQGPAKGEHYGSFIESEMIRRFKPSLVLCGHMHENQGRDKLGNSVIVNSGAFYEKKFAIVDWDEENGKVKKVRFVK